MTFVNSTTVQKSYDVVVIGGGITGVSVAREAATSGLSVIVIDKSDFGSGTSSATTKYIHGGIRYLERLEFDVVRESLRERRILALAAPHLVEQRRFIMPTWRWSKPNALMLGAGMALYDGLSYDRNKNAPSSLRIPHPGWLSKEQTTKAIPWLITDQLQGAWYYHDTLNVFPERLLLAFLMSAIDTGADAWSHARVTDVRLDTFDHNKGGIVVDVEDTLGDSRGTLNVSARVVVNAAGPWVDTVLGKAVPGRVNVLRSKGVHVLAPQRPGMEIKDTVFARAESGNHVVVSPWQGKLLIGPTDTPMEESADEAQATYEDVNLVLGVFNETLQRDVSPVGMDDVEGTTVGIRPLVGMGGADTYKASRRHTFIDHASDGLSGLYTIVGGKWTTGRATGEQMLDLAFKKHPELAARATSRVSTRRLPVAGAFGWAVDPEPFLSHAVPQWTAAGVSEAVARHVLRLYGTQAGALLELVRAEPGLGRRVSSRSGVLDICVQAVWAVHAEGARTLADVIDRRLVIGTLGSLEASEVLTISETIAPLLGIDAVSAAQAEVRRRAAVASAITQQRSK